MYHVIQDSKLSILDSTADAIVNPVNCQGTMGKGLAKAIKEKFPVAFNAYKEQCDAGLMRIGMVHLVAIRQKSPRYIINFPTKLEWSRPSEVGWIAEGLIDLKSMLNHEQSIKTIAIPALGCGLGGLDFEVQVLPLLKLAFTWERVSAHFYPPWSKQ